MSPQDPEAKERRRARVLIPLDADAALRALMEFTRSQDTRVEPAPPARD